MIIEARRAVHGQPQFYIAKIGRKKQNMRRNTENISRNKQNISRNKQNIGSSKQNIRRNQQNIKCEESEAKAWFSWRVAFGGPAGGFWRSGGSPVESAVPS